jgi:hypothetical protein
MALLLALTMAAGSVLAEPPGSGWWVFFQIQNVGDADGTLTSMDAYREDDKDDDTEYKGTNFDIGSGEALAFHPGLDATYPSGDRIGFTNSLPGGFQGAVVLTADVPIAAVAQIGNNQSGSVGVSDGTATAFYQGIDGSAVGTRVSFPTLKHNYNGQTTTFYIQAAGEAANATITYRVGTASYTQNVPIEANHMFVFDPANATNPGPVPAGSLGSATVESTTGPIAGVVVEHPHTGSPAAFVLSTRGFTPDDEDLEIIAPTIKSNFKGSTTGWSVQNVGEVQTTVYVTFTVTSSEAGGPAAGTQYTDSEEVGPGGSVVFSRFRNNLGGMPEGVFAAGEASADQKLVGSVNESKTQANIPGGKAKAVYACFPKSKATDTVALPLVKEIFKGKTTGVSVVNAGDAPTQFIATYTDAAKASKTFQTISTNIQPGEAVSFFQVCNDPDPGGKFSGSLPACGTKNSAIITSSNGQPIVALAQESDRADKLLDIKNYEGFNLP